MSRSDRTPEQEWTVFSYWRTNVPEWKESNDRIAALWREHPEGASQLVVTEREKPRETHLLTRGDFLNPAQAVTPGVPAFLNPLPAGAPVNRLTFAKWMVAPDSPTTARSYVNREWQAWFGTGIVATTENLGTQCEPPTHPELLDWLAVEFMNRGWSIKQMHRLLMTSEAYQMSSKYNDAADTEKDPENDYLWRFRIQRLDAEIVRDVMMSASGALDLKMGGPPIFPHLPEETLDSMKYGIWEREADGPKVWRRSVYVYRKRGLPFPMFEVFDLPDQNTSCGRRNVSTVPTQALTLLNDEFVLKQSKLFADRVAEAAPNDPAKQVDLAYRIALTRPPNEREMTAAMEFLKKRALADFTHVLLNLNEFLYVR
jgi:hypothetical protein